MVIDTFTIVGRFSSLPFTESTAWLVSIAGRPRCCLVGSIYMQIPTIKRRNEGVDGAFVHTRKWVIRTTRYRDEFASLTIQSDPTQLLQLEMGQLANFSKPIVPICEISELHSISFYVFFFFFFFSSMITRVKNSSTFFTDVFVRPIKTENNNPGGLE